MPPSNPTLGLTVVDAFNLASAIASLVLSVLAIVLAIMFWRQATTTEGAVHCWS